MIFKLIQQNIVWGDPETNRRHLDELMSDIAPGSADVIVLPEMFSTGFVTSNPEYAENLPSATVEWMKSKAAEKDCAIAGSVAVHAGGRQETGLSDRNPSEISPDRCLNRFFFVKPDGGVTAYDKRHLFAYGGEDKTFDSGFNRVVVEWRGVKMLLAVCYDIRFPVWLRNKGDYDGILLVANWPDRRRYVWEVLKRARAIENQCFVAAVNRCGHDPVCNYDGGTAFMNPYGEVLAEVQDDSEAIITAEFNLAALDDYRSKFPVMQDADKFELI